MTNRGLIGFRSLDPSINNRANTYTTDGVLHDVTDIYTSSIYPNRWVKDTNSNFNPRIRSKTNQNLYTFTAQTNAARDGSVSANGDFLYVVSATTIFQYALSTPYDVTSATFLRSQIIPTEIDITAIKFKPEGDRVFILGRTRDTIAFHDLSESWNIQSISASPIVTSANLNPRLDLVDLDISSDGNKLFLHDRTRKEFLQYELPESWNIATTAPTMNSYLSYVSIGGMTFHNSMELSPDGKTLMILGNSATSGDNYINVLNLQQAYNLNSAFYSAKVSVMELIAGNPTVGNVVFPTVTSFKFSSDGRKVYVFTTERVYQIDVPEPFSLHLYTQSSVWSYLTAITDGQGVYVKPDGTYFYITDKTDDVIYQYEMTTPWDITTSELLRTKRYQIVSDPGRTTQQVLPNEEGNSTDLTFSPDGTKMYLVGGKRTVYQFTLSTPWDIDTVTYANKLFFIEDYEKDPTGIDFSSDGTKMFVVGSGQDSIIRFDLNTPWDVSTARFHFRDFSLSESVIGPEFSDDGSKFYLLGRTTDTIYEYDTSTNFEVLGSTYTGNSYSVNTETQSATDFKITDSGTKLYVLGSVSRTIYRYTLSTPWDIESALYDNNFRTVSQVETNPVAFDISSDGTRVYVIGTVLRRVVEYKLYEPWNLLRSYIEEHVFTSPTYFRLDGAVLGSTAEALQRNISFKNDGSKMYIYGTTLGRIVEYDLDYPWDPRSYNKPYNDINAFLLNSGFHINWNSGNNKLFICQSSATAGQLIQLTLQTPGKIETAIYDNIVQSFTTGAQSIRFKDDGKRLYVLQTVNDRVDQYDLVAPWNIASITANGNFSVTGLETAPTGFDFNEDGTKMWVVGQTNDQVIEFRLWDPWNVTTAYTGRFLSTTQDSLLNGIYLKPDGTKMYLLGQTNDRVYEYNLLDPFGIGSAVFVQFLNVTDKDATPTGLYFSENGDYLYMIGSTSDSIHQYTLSTPWDLSSASFTRTQSVSAQDTVPEGLFISNDGLNLYTIGSTNDRVYQYSMSSAWDISTLSFVRFYGVATQDAIPKGLSFNPDGTKMYIIGDTNDRVYQYNLGTAWNISTAIFNSFVGIGTDPAVPTDMHLSRDGSKLYTINATQVFEFSLGTPESISTAFTNYRFSVLAQNTAMTGFKFRNNGNSFYTVAAAAIYQYDLTSSWNIGTASFARTFNLTNFENATTGLNFKPDGSEVYITGTQKDVIIRFLMTENWNVSTMYYKPENTLNVLSTMSEASMTGFSFSEDGNVLFTTGQGSLRIQRYDLSESWNISTATANGFSTRSLSISPIDGILANNGNSFFIIQKTGLNPQSNGVIQIDLNQPYDAVNISVPLIGVTAGTLETATTGIYWRNDGTRFFTVGTTRDAISQFNCVVPWQVGGATYAGNTTIAQDTDLRDVYFRDNGLEFYTVGTTNDLVRKYTMTTAWTVTSGVAFNTASAAVAEGTPQAIEFKPDGLVHYVVGQTNDIIYQYGLATAWTVTSTRTLQKQLSIGSIEPVAVALRFNDDGTKMFVLGSSSQAIHEFVLGTAYEVDTATLNFTYSISNLREAAFQGMAFKTDGTRMWIVGSGRNVVYQYELSTAWDLSTARIGIYDFELTGENLPVGIAFANSGYSMYIMGQTLDFIDQYNLNTPYSLKAPSGEDVVTLPTSRRLNTVTLDTLPVSLYVSPDAKKVFSIGATAPRKIINIEMQTADNVATGMYQKLNTAAILPTSIEIANDNTELYVVDSGTPANSIVYKYSLTVANTTPSGNNRLTQAKPLPIANLQHINITDNNKSIYYSTVDNNIIRYQMINPSDLSNSSVANVTYISDSMPDDMKWSAVFRGTPINYVSVDNLVMGSGDFTIEGWFYFTSAPASPILWDWRPNTLNGVYPCLYMDFTTRTLRYYVSTADRITSAAINLNEWLHISVVKSSNNTRLYINGVQQGVTYADTNNYLSAAARPIIGASGAAVGTGGVFGYISNFRIVRGTAITPSLGGNYIPFANVTNTVLLTFNSGSLTDSSNNFTITNTGNTFTTIFSPEVESSPQSVVLSANGDYVYILGPASDKVTQFELTTPYQPNTATYTGNLSIIYQDTNSTSLDFSANGDNLYVLGLANNSVQQYNLSTPWTVNTATFTAASINLDDTGETAYGGVFVNRDGNYLYVLGSLKNTVYRFELTSPKTLSTISKTYQSYNASSILTNSTGLTFSQDGTKMYIISNTAPARVFQFLLSTPWDLTTVSYQSSLNISARETLPTGIQFNYEGSRLFIIGATGDDITQYLLPTPWSINVATTTGDLGLTTRVTSLAVSQITSPQDFSFGEDGQYMIVLGDGEVTTGTTPSDIGNINILQVRNLKDQYNTAINDVVLTLGLDNSQAMVNARGFSVSSDGSKLWVVDSGKSRVFEYTIK